MGRMTDQAARYEAEGERFLRVARERGLLSGTDVDRLRAAHYASMRRENKAPASILPRLLLEAEDGVVLGALARPERANDRWSLYEAIREQTQAEALGGAA